MGRMQQPVVGDSLLEINSDLIAAATLDQFFGPWAVHEPWLTQTISTLQTLDFQAHALRSVAPGTESIGYNLHDGVAIVSIHGAMSKRGSSMSTEGSTVVARRALGNAAADPAVQAVMLHIESPGGTVAGTKELADAVAASDKPVHAYIEDLGASAAYYVASQATHITANEPAMVGSIGTYSVLIDASEAAKQQGVKVHVVKAGEFKGLGTMGTEVTEQQLAEMQQIIDKSNGLFLQAVASGRQLSMAQVKQLADGRVHLSSDAKELGLIDSVGTLATAMERLKNSVNSRSRTMPVETTPVANDDTPVVAADKPATIAELEAACPSADPNFYLEQIKGGATVQQAQLAFISWQQAKLDAMQADAASLQRKAEEAEAKAKQAAAVPPGNQLPSDDANLESWQVDASADPISTWNRLVEEKLAAGKNRLDASVEVSAENPGLRDAMRAAFKPQNKRRE